MKKITLFLLLTLVAGCTGLNKKETLQIKKHNDLCYREFQMQKKHYDAEYQTAIEARYKQVRKLLNNALDIKEISEEVTANGK